MYSTGIVRKVDELGRVVIPVELRRNLSINEKDALEIFVEGDTIILKKYIPCCVFCGEGRETTIFETLNICENCIGEIKKINREPHKEGE